MGDSDYNSVVDQTWNAHIITTTIREVSPCHTWFARRNLFYIPSTINGAYPRNCLQFHRDNWNQIYYVMNEPDLGGSGRVGHDTAKIPTNFDNCWARPAEASGSLIDSDYLSVGWGNSFWEVGGSPSLGLHCSDSSSRRISPKRLAYAYWQIKQYVENYGHGHVVLPPAMAGSDFIDPYWRQFYDCLHTNVYGTNAPVSLSSMSVLHFHRYFYGPATYPDNPPPAPPNTLINRIKNEIIDLKTKISNYKNTYAPSAPTLDMDLLISETGLTHWAWSDYRKWGAGWKDAKIINWFSTQLFWISQVNSNPSDPNSNIFNQSPNKKLYICLHEPSNAPYTLPITVTSNTTANLKYLWIATTSMASYTWNNAPFYWIGTGNSGVYREVIPLVQPISTPNCHFSSYYLAPLGACYAVWAAAQNYSPNIYSFYSGYYESQNNGFNASTQVNLNDGWNTVYIPVVKRSGAFSASDKINLCWKRYYSGSVTTQWYGQIDLDPAYFIDSDPSGTVPVYSSMVFPIVCFSVGASTVTIEFHRTSSGNKVWIGQPIVLPTVCSWLSNQ